MNRLRRLCAPAVALALALVQALAVAQGDAPQRQRPPAPGPARPLQLPVARESRLANGVTLVLVEDHRAPLVTLVAGVAQKINWRHTVAEITNQMTLVEATADLLVEGQGESFARGVESLGAQVDSHAGADYAILSGVVIAENTERLLALFADALARPKFLAHEVTLYKNSRIDKLNVERQEPDFLAREHFNRLIFGAHPYAFSAPTPATVRALSRARIEQFYKAAYSPAATAVVIVGDFDAARMQARAQATLGRWRTMSQSTGRVLKRTAAAPPPAATRRIYLIDRPGSAQANFRIGNLAVARGDKDYYALEVANAILGDGTGSRLFQDIREQQGFAYDVASALSAMKTGGAFFGFAQSRTEVTAAAIKAMLAEFERLRNVGVTAEDLQNARHYLTGLFSLSLATQNGVAEELLTMRLMGLGADYLKDYRARIEAVTAADVQRVARRYVRTDDATVVVVGDAARLREELAALGTVVLVNTKSAAR
ncbi:MAG TPA: pitrilysin family protein [Blastocatellia bacterium]|nr:pitrilysin family protein [Blastocatellia bacterium]